ncbi:MAG: L-glutamate gamma-semialdehyde dehydrogenase [Bacteroidetes bacterium]|nr:L-glutamate gamma-semialdehyde dehydrogenase [Bacteroidota bacterium]
MSGIFRVPKAVNEPVLDYMPGSKERENLKKTIDELRSKEIVAGMHINGEIIHTDKRAIMRPPHDLSHKLGEYSVGDATHVTAAIDAAMKAKKNWNLLPWEQRAAIFLKAADLIAGPYRAKINAATMLCQSKNVYQAEIDAACEMIDFLRFNVQYMYEIYTEQPTENSKTIWNRIEYRPLEGFVFALTPFNFTAISGNLPTSAALMGNTVVWKPANTQIYSANILMEIFEEAGLPPGVINLIYVSGPTAGDIIFKHPDFAGIHFTGSTEIFRQIWKDIGNNIEKYKSYPRIVGETGGKDFVMVHKSADVDTVVAALSRGAFEYQGQKCSAASRAYIPMSLWNEIKNKLVSEVKSMKMGPTEDFSNFINAVIDEKSFNKLASYIDDAKNDKSVEILTGGNYNKTKGYFIEPTIILVSDPKYKTMCEELFGPVLTIFVYNDEEFETTLELVDNTSEYALTGCIIAQDRYAINIATQKLSNSAGNFYINDKPTGAVVGQQPFGGARGSGTNDKAGAKVNLLRWVSMRTIKENFVPPKDYRYPFLNT